MLSVVKEAICSVKWGEKSGRALSKNIVKLALMQKTTESSAVKWCQVVSSGVKWSTRTRIAHSCCI